MFSSARMWRLFETYHAVVYFDAAAAKAQARQVGWPGFWTWYVATRSAPLGPVPAPVVTAAFFGFAPRMVERALLTAWEACSPARALELRVALADQVLRRLLGDVVVEGPEVGEAADLALAAARAVEVGGRPLAAANTVVPVPAEPHLALWQATTVLREHRGDGHVATLVAAGVSPLEAHVLAVEAGVTSRSALLPNRGWTEEEWAAAEDSARRFPPGLRAEVDAATDVAAAAPWLALGGERTDRLAELLTGLVELIVSGGGVVYPNAIGLPPPPGQSTRKVP